MDPKTVARRSFEEVWSKGDFRVADEIVAANVVGREAGRPPMEGREAVKSFGKTLRTAFPDLALEVTHQVLEGDLVATRWTATGTHDGEFRGIAATGNRVSFSGIHLQRARDGRIVEGWANWDAVSVLQAIGALPGPR